MSRRYTFDGQPIYLLGERPSEFHRQIDIQDFYTIRQKCLDKKILFEDDTFPANDKSLFYSRPVNTQIEWLRPFELCKNPRFFVEGFSRFDVRQGELGDCWFIAAVANLTQNQKLFSRVVHDDNSFVKNYAGIFHFCFWRFGKWIDVVIDDRLPTYGGKLLYMRSSQNNEFWSALLEKAYAKVHGTYELLRGGIASDAMEDFTGGVSERYNLSPPPDDLFNIIGKRMKRHSLLCSSIEPNPRVSEENTPEGLVRGHAYSITKAQFVEIITPNKSGMIPLLRMRNPWGNQVEWNGAWSDKSKEWRYIPDHVKKQIGLTFDNDGEFWMSYSDFIKYFDNLDICNLSPESYEDEDESSTHLRRKWNMNVFEGEWVAGITAGGCRNFIESYHKNPQYVLKLEDPDEKDDEAKCTVLVSLMQKYRRMKKVMGLDFLTIGFEIYRIDEKHLQEKPLKNNFFKFNRYIARTPQFINLRCINGRFDLVPGHYLIIPSTFEPNNEGEFLIRVFSEIKNVLEEHDETVRSGDIDIRVQDLLPDIQQPTPERLTIEKLFLEVSGGANEIGWRELKEVLDRYVRKEILKDSITVAYGNLYESKNDDALENEQNRSDRSFLQAVLDIFNMCKRSTSSTKINENYFARSSNAHAPLLAQNEPESEGFSKDVCRSMVAMLDADRSGKLGLEEFRTLLCEIAKWKAVFKLYDKDNNNKLDSFELREAFESAGFYLSNQVLSSLWYRFGASDYTMTLDDFILCAVKVKTMIERFKEKDHHNMNQASFSLDEWIAKALYS